MQKLSCLLFFVFCSVFLFAQNKYTISGYIKDAASGETLIGASLYLKSDLGVGATTNLYGFYSLTLEEGIHALKVSYMGFQDYEVEVNLIEDTKLNINLSEGMMMKEIVVTDERKDENIESTEMGTVELDVDQIKKMPALLGEIDILKTIQLLPGVLSAGEGNAGFYVRGGGPDQNLILLDEAVVYNTGHLFGFFSVFNADAIKNTTLIKGSMPANYGGRLSSVVDIQMKDGNDQRFALDGGIGLIASRLTLQGPIIKDKSSFLISGRRTYAFDIAQPLLNKTDFAGTNYFFYDLNTKFNYRFSDKDRFFFSGYFGKDVLNYVSNNRGFSFKMPWGNTTATLRWNHLFSDKLFVNTSLIYNDYDFGAEGEQSDFKFKLTSGVKDWNGKVDFDFYPSPNHRVQFGLNYTYHTFTPNSASAVSGDIDFENGSKKKFAHESAIYIMDDWKINNRLSANIGLRGSMFSQVGPYVNSDSSRVYKKLEPVKRYLGMEPRLSMKYKLTASSSIKGGIALTNQFIHLVVSSTSTLPTDLWVPSTEKVKPQIGLQYALGYFQNFADNMFESSVEVYYKDLRNQIEYAESYVPDLTTDEEDEFVFGRGRSYGAEFFFKKRKGKLNGWIGYTISKTYRYFDDIDNGNPFPAKYDRTHDLSIVASYDLNKTWSLSSTFVYGTGNAFTVPESFYFINFQLNARYGPRNASRLDAYHRLDFAATCNLKAKKNKPFQSSLTFSVYNIYNRKNTFLVYYDPQSDAVSGSLDLKAYKVSLFPVIPAITYNFKWRQKKKETALMEE